VYRAIELTKNVTTFQLFIDKWSRPIVKLSQDYRTKKINYAEGDRQSTTQRRRYDNAAAAAASAE
jgi:transcription factor SPN1